MNIPVTGTNADAARIARAAAEAHERDGLSRVTINGQTFKLDERGWCSKFTRQVCAAVTGIQWPPWAGRFAVWTERNLAQQGFAVDAPEAGDLVCFNALVYQRHGRHNVWGWSAWRVKRDRAVGHIGVLVSKEQVAENTSSNVRGPGTVISPLSALASRISGYYRPLKSAQKPFRVDYVGTYLREQDAELRDGHTWVRLGAVLPIEDYLSSLPDPPVGRHMVWRPEKRKVFVKVGHVEEQEEEI